MRNIRGLFAIYIYKIGFIRDAFKNVDKQNQNNLF